MIPWKSLWNDHIIQSSFSRCSLSWLLCSGPESPPPNFSSISLPYDLLYPSHFFSAIPHILYTTSWALLLCLQHLKTITEVQWAKKQVILASTEHFNAIDNGEKKKQQLWTASKIPSIEITSVCSWDGFCSHLSKRASLDCLAIHRVAFWMKV